MSDPWIGVYGTLAGAIVGAILGFVLTELARRLERNRERGRIWSALRAEVEHCAADAQGFLDWNIMAPLWRLPQDAYRQAVNASALSTTGEASAFATFYSPVDQLNRGLDRVAEAADRGGARANDEHGRNRLKAGRLIHGGEHYAEVDRILNARLV
ncbi:MAG TPA: hypothetical protein VEY94_00470 [Patescibacteria group bacterium]|nr:hypothetical protein [Patescibacteria group bacterium]